MMKLLLLTCLLLSASGLFGQSLQRTSTTKSNNDLNERVLPVALTKNNRTSFRSSTPPKNSTPGSYNRNCCSKLSASTKSYSISKVIFDQLPESRKKFILENSTIYTITEN
jgi:hypothetical protein